MQVGVINLQEVQKIDNSKLNRRLSEVELSQVEIKKGSMATLKHKPV